jgi:hypothetical protein
MLMPHKPKYAVKYVGYAAYVVARGKCGTEIDYATIDFVSGAVSLHANGGSILSPNRNDVASFVNELPELANDLQARLRDPSKQEDCTVAAGDFITVPYGLRSVTVAAGTEINGLIRDVNKRFKEIARLLEQAEEIGLRIKRRPYPEYLNEIANTGIARVEGQGFALLIDEKLIFHPDYQVALVRSTSSGSHAFDLTLHK